jgi:hydrogenase nickel incorporation protein HypB
MIMLKFCQDNQTGMTRERKKRKIFIIMEDESMDNFRILEIKQSVFEDNDHQANLLREELKKEKTFLLNLMSSPGSGKTTTLTRTINTLKNEMRIGVMEADIDSDVDAYTISKTGVKVIQLHTGGMCHLDADMTKQGLKALGTEDIDFAILENVGNLVCPAEFDTGASKNAMILSVPEGDDKPLKYPLMFSIVDVLLINKIDVLEYFDFDLEVCKERVKKLNPNIKIIPISARTGEGIDEFADWIRSQVKNWN